MPDGTWVGIGIDWAHVGPVATDVVLVENTSGTVSVLGDSLALVLCSCLRAPDKDPNQDERGVGELGCEDCFRL